jgi:hypothetical protein
MLKSCAGKDSLGWFHRDRTPPVVTYITDADYYPLPVVPARERQNSERRQNRHGSK